MFTLQHFLKIPFIALCFIGSFDFINFPHRSKLLYMYSGCRDFSLNQVWFSNGKGVGIFLKCALDSQNAAFLHYFWQNILTKWCGWVPTPDPFLDPPVNRATMVLQRMEIIFVHLI
jgi:hypothetical protein